MSMFPDGLIAETEALLDAYRGAGLKIATAESCTGGLLAACLTEIAGSSDVVERGFVTYSNAAKIEDLDVSPELLHAHGAVSAEVAVSLTGIAGPGGASADKPAGLVYLGGARRGRVPRHERHLLPGDRGAVRLASVVAALDLLRRLM